MRGKHSQIADRRREVNEVVTELEALRRHNVNLRNELKATVDSAEREREVHAQRIRKLSAQVNEGVSDELYALRKELEVTRETLAAAKAELAEQKKRLGKVATALMTLLGKDMSPLEAMEEVMRIAGGDFDAVIEGIPQFAAGKLGTERIKALQRARGLRS